MFSYEYPRPCVVVDCVVTYAPLWGESLQVLLIQRGKEPFRGMWALPGGFMNMDETCEQAAIRELKEETGCSVRLLGQVGTFSRVDRDPRDRMISVAFYGSLDSPVEETKAGDDAVAAIWFSLDNLPKLAFDHDKIISVALKLYNK